MLDVVVYVPDYDAEHERVLKAFAKGAGAEVRPVTAYRKSDVAVIYGLAKRKVAKTMTKKVVIDGQIQGHDLNAILYPHPIITIDSAPVKRGVYWQVGWGAALGGNLDCENENMPTDRWDALKVPLQAWRVEKPDKPVVVCGQVPWDANVQDTDHIGWCKAAMDYFERMDVPVRFRPHPRLRGNEYGIPQDKWQYAHGLDELWNFARSIVTFNSTIGTDALIAGVPTVAMDRGSFAYPVAEHAFYSAVHPSEYTPAAATKRMQWAADLAYAQWNLDELNSGEAWKHLTRGLCNNQPAKSSTTPVMSRLVE